MAGLPHRIKVVVFDLDDTLYPERQYIRSGYAAVGRHLRRRLSRDEPFERWLWRRFLAGKAERAFDALSEQFGLGLSAEQIAELVVVYREHRPQISPYGGAAELLGLLHGRYRLGLLSDGFLPAQRWKLEALKLRRFFDAVVFTEEIGREAWKPSTAGFEMLRDHFGAADTQCVYVADNPAKDFLGPGKLGWLTIQWLHPGQIHAGNPAPPGGDPQRIARSPGQIHEALL